MNPFDEFRQNVTRRHFLAAGSHLLGTAALASLGRQRAGTCAAARPAPATTLRCTHFAPKAKHVIYLHMVGGPSQMDLFDYKPVMKRVVRQGPARIGPHGPAAHDDDQRPGPLSRSRRRSTSSSSAASAACGSASCCRGRQEDGRRHVLHPQHAHRGDQPRAGDHATCRPATR